MEVKFIIIAGKITKASFKIEEKWKKKIIIIKSSQRTATAATATQHQ